ncbi:amino acid adenylation domain-containing protein [Streptomyces ehimensis]|uniref:Amino acid adenylation domain-containing protein n=1 Tax=Streptomyces ehimensis TaxID=68195 RepID=A0ABV9BTC8_9ACTN
MVDVQKGTPLRYTNQCIHDLVSNAVQQGPRAPAVVSPTATLTYAELDQRANALADELQKRDVGPEVLVGVHLPKSPEMVISILAILKAGGAYVPLDPASPVDRLSDVPVRLVLSQGGTARRSAASGAPVLRLDDEWDLTTSQPEFVPARPAHPDNLAYVIYTSGSTGRPKGVAVTHRSLVGSTLARHAWYQPPQAFLLLSAMAFDSAVAGILGTLTRGGALHLPAPGSESDLDTVAGTIRRGGIDAVLTLPSLYELLLETAQSSALASLRTVTVAGERCPPGLPAKSRARLPEVDLLNEYGPTEGTVWSTVWRAPDEGLVGLATVPIGRPVDGVRVSVLDRAGSPVPDGVPGELYIGGDGLARGYYERPDLTAAAFEPDPAGPPGARRYRTGDQVCRRPDGELEFLGRIDRQVKVRGYRIEPDEIEDAMQRHPDILQAAVVTPAGSGDTTLVAFVTGASADPVKLRNFLGGMLPAYMVPSEIRRLDRLPLTPNGKVDLRALEAIAHSPAVLTGDDAPRGAVETTVAAVWCEILGIPHVGRSQSFLDIGGSLAVVRVALRLSQVFGAQIPLLWVYEAPTVTDLAEWLKVNITNTTATAEAYQREVE